MTNLQNETAMAVTDNSYSIMPRNLQTQIHEAVQMRDALTQLFNELLELGKDFDRLPCTDKPILLKPGAEMLCKVFKLAPGKVEVLDKEIDWDKGIFAYTVGMPLIHIDSGSMIAYGTGAANSHEKKYRYRKSKDEQGRDIQIENSDPADGMNTLIKMASKRAFIDAVLKATAASRMFTQDMEDLSELTKQYEIASTNQLYLIKKLYSDVSDKRALDEISQLCNRDIKKFEEIYRSEASLIIDSKKKGSSASNEALNCVDCGVAITSAEYGYSNKKYGRPLCRNCQGVARQGESNN